jgi:L-ascorbate metabolism protein UlaG (beta-lactamase superfamily)
VPIEITYLGRNCFRLKGRDGTVITDPCPPDSGFTLGKQTAEVVTLSRKDDPGYSWAEGVGGSPMVLDAPGEYEIGGILVTGIATKGADGTRNVVFVSRSTDPGGTPGAWRPQRSGLKNVDVLLLPVGVRTRLRRTWRPT